MPLTINLKPRERLIVNGVVIENSGQLAKILIHNNAALLREKDIITEEQATTPARTDLFRHPVRISVPGQGRPVFTDHLPLSHRVRRSGTEHG